MDPDWTPPRGGQRHGEERGRSGAPCVTTRRSAAAGSSSQAAWPPSPGADLSSLDDEDLFSDTDGTDENTDDEEEETPHAARRTPHAAAARRRPQAAGKRKAKAAPACKQEDRRARARELAERRRRRHEALLPPQKELRTAEARRLRAMSERLALPEPDDAAASGAFMDSVLGNYVGSLRVEGEARGATARAGFTPTQTLVAGMPIPPRCRFVAGFDKINAAAQAAAARQKEAAAAELARPPVAEAEGLRLHLSSSNGTRYRGVRGMRGGRFQVRHGVDGRCDGLGTFGTAVEAAVAYARAVGEEGANAEEAEGLRLHLSSSNSTGYRGVREHSGRLQAKHRVAGKEVSLGYFDTAVEAAVAYARAVGEAPAAT